MTQVNFKYDGCAYELTASGHAGYAEVGEPDIVCASLSVLSFQLAKVIDGLYESGKLKTEPVVILNDGNVTIRCVPLKKYETETSYAFDFSFAGFSLLAENYPDNVKINRES